MLLPPEVSIGPHARWSRMRFLVRFLPTNWYQEEFLGTVRSVARGVGVDTRNPKWTSRGSLELDVFAQSKGDFLLFLAAAEPIGIVEFWRDLNVAPKHMEREQLASEARAYFNAERYWECHEILEALWRTLTGEEKLFVQGIILVCAAFVHHQKAEDEIAMGVLERAAAQLGWKERLYLGIDVDSLRLNVSDVLGTRRFSTFKI